MDQRKPPSTSTGEIASRARGPQSIFTVDVEDWFHILDLPSTPELEMWDNLPSRVEANFHHLLDLFSVRQVSVTCFFLGWIGERFPHLVLEAVKRGHEVASHGYSHRLAYKMGRDEFYEDAVRSRELLEDISGSAVCGYRSAGFSVNHQTPWFFEQLAAAGYQYDSSVFPANRAYGGMPKAHRTPYRMVRGANDLIEFPMTVANLGARPVCFFGGGYLRLFPYWLIRQKAKEVLRSGRPLVFYIHPREIDPDHPRLAMGPFQKFKSYVNLSGTESKIVRILQEFPVTTFQKFLEHYGYQSLPNVA